MPESGMLKEAHVLDEFLIYEFRIGTPDVDAVEAFGNILQKLSEKAKDKKGYDAVYSNVAGMLKYPEIWIIFSAGLRTSVEECKKIPDKKLLKIYPKIMEVNKHFFAETPEMIVRINAVLISEMTDLTSQPTTESNSTKKT